METEGILAGYIDRAALAEQLRCSEKTIARYEAVADGLPSVMIGSRKFYRVQAVRDWISKRERKPNERRVA